MDKVNRILYFNKEMELMLTILELDFKYLHKILIIIMEINQL